MLLRSVILYWILLFSISLESHPHPSSTICLKNRVHPLTTKKSHLSFFEASNPKKMAVIESIEDNQITDSPKYRMHLIHTHMNYITAEINDVDSIVENLISSSPDYKNAVQLLCTIPSVKHDSAITIISEISIDMSQFL